MRAFTTFSIVTTFLTCLSTAAPTVEQVAHKTKKGHPATRQSAFPFKQVVAFGDNLSDNGNGSWSWGLVSEGKEPQPSIYGHRTWTDGPVAVSYLVDLLGVPLTSDYAVGHANGGSKFGATINNTYTNSPAGAPDAFTQVHNYTSSGVSKADIADTMHFLWIGANDINLHHIYVWGGFQNINNNFASAMARQTAELVQRLLDAGSNYVFVPNLYPKDISPSSKFYASNPSQLAVLNNTIELANAAIKTALEPFGEKAIYYDVNAFMKKVWTNHDSYGITHVGGEYCDGYSQEDWDLCVTEKKGYEFYWMQDLDMVTTVHKLIAGDMYQTLKGHFGVK